MQYLYTRVHGSKDVDLKDFMPTAPRAANKPATGLEIIARFRALAGK